MGSGLFDNYALFVAETWIAIANTNTVIKKNGSVQID